MPLVCTDVGMRRVVTAHPALMGVTMSLGPGELVGVVGCSGAGKTTLLRLLAGRDLPTEGSVFLDAAYYRAMMQRAATSRHTWGW